MIYREFQGEKLSVLGMGAMRLPVVDGDDARIDEAAAAAMVNYAMAHGVNYYDTAWGYHNGNSELVMGRALARYPRESYFLADKFPGYDLSNMDKVGAIFEKQLEKCGKAAGKMRRRILRLLPVPQRLRDEHRRVPRPEVRHL